MSPLIWKSIWHSLKFHEILWIPIRLRWKFKSPCFLLLLCQKSCVTRHGLWWRLFVRLVRTGPAGWKKTMSRLGLAMVVAISAHAMLQNVQSSYIFLMHWTLNKQVVFVENPLCISESVVLNSLEMFWRIVHNWRLRTPNMSVQPWEIPVRIQALASGSSTVARKVTSLHSLHRPCEFCPASFKDCLANGSPGRLFNHGLLANQRSFQSPQLCGAAMPGRMPLGQQHISTGLMIFVSVSSWCDFNKVP